MGIDPVLTPNMYAVATFASQAFELAVRLPIETVLRRGQMATLSAPVAAANPRSRKVGAVVDTTVEIGPYKGLLGTMYHIVFEEGTRGSHTEQLARASGNAAGVRPAVEKKKKGQGLEGLWRGWRVGMWGLVGVWSATSIGAIGGKEGEF
jgi:fusion and transport protein UGO1